MTIMNIEGYLSEVQRIYKTGAATEHSYRAALQKLFSSISPDVKALNEPKRVKCGAPDFLVNRGQIVIGHVEAKDIAKDLTTLKGAEADQKGRYLKALPNLIYTNCLDFEFYREGVLLNKVSIADFLKGIRPLPLQFKVLENQLRDFISQKPQTITSAERLAEIMAGKAVLIKDVLFNALREDKDLQTEIAGQYKAFQEHLIHDITPEDFADIYAETIAYGMFAARLHDKTLDTFSRHEALDLLPKSNPFLRSLFGYIAGQDLDERISWIIDDLADVFQATNVKKLLQNFGSLTGRNDPFLHFYETFLAKYNPAKRKARGVWYTPEAVVNYIVRAVDDVLQAEFGLADGLADTSKVTIDWDTGQTDRKGKPVTIKKQVHRVQILDPATGTGTFLAEVIKEIAPKVKGEAAGMWSGYIERELIPRLHGFELLMASYAMCHMKLDMVLGELGYKPSKAPPRLGVYLTNSLEEGEREVRDLFMAQWLTREAREANNVKRQQPIMCVIGNPPYNSSGKNNSDWIRKELAEYKKGLNEQKINLDDDYIKFIRLAEVLIEKNNGGIIAMITNNSFLDGATQRVMRRHLRETFDAIYITNLHGDIRNESTDSEQDENVFDITQGVSISIMYVKGPIDRKNLCPVMYRDIIGKRKAKYEELFSSEILGGDFVPVRADAPLFRFLPETNMRRTQYEKGFIVTKLFETYSSGVQTKRDAICIAYDEQSLDVILSDFRRLEEEDLRAKYELPKDGRDWTISLAKKDVMSGDGAIVPFLYKPFDIRYFYYSGKTKGFVAYPRREVMQNMVGKKNLALIINRQTVKDYFSFVGVTNIACCHGTFYLGNRGQDYCLPLYIYPDEHGLDKERRVNYNRKLWKKLQSLAEHPKHGRPSEVAAFDYIYGVLHCPAYRETYAEFLKVDFPKIPWPSCPQEFWDIAEKGEQLRRLHLMEPKAIDASPFPFEGKGNAHVENFCFDGGRIWINEKQYFDDVPRIAWEFFVGGYQPAQKWLKDRRGRQLSFEEVKHYQRIIRVLVETDRIMRTISMKLEAA